MPVKNKARPSNSGFEGEIIGLTKNEKNILGSNLTTKEEYDKLVKEVPTDIIYKNGLTLMHDSVEITKQTNKVQFKTINSNNIVGTGDIKIDVPQVKTIALFGDKSILVPTTFKESNIDIYCHMVHIIGSPTVSDFDIYFEFYSSKNLECNSLQDLKTLLGNTFTRSCNGIAKTKQAYAITELKVLTMSGEELLTGITIEDTVKTI